VFASFAGTVAVRSLGRRGAGRGRSRGRCFLGATTLASSPWLLRVVRNLLKEDFAVHGDGCGFSLYSTSLDPL